MNANDDKVLALHRALAMVEFRLEMFLRVVEYSTTGDYDMAFLFANVGMN